VDADGTTWWVVSGCGSTEANGRYYQGEVKNDYGESYKIYYQQGGSCSLVYDNYNGCWAVKSVSTVLYRNDNLDYYNGDPSQCVNWMTDSGVEPVPTIATETTTGNGWQGKKYNTETGEVAEEVTELEYKYKAPTIGKFYTADASITCIVYEKPELLLYAPCHNYGQEIESFAYGATPAMNYVSISETNFGVVAGVPCVTGSSKNYMTAQLGIGELKKFSASFMFRSPGSTNFGTAVSFSRAFEQTYDNIYLGVIKETNKVGQGDYTGVDYTNFELNTWVHYMYVVDENKEDYLYINGVLISKGKSSYNRHFNYLAVLTMGKSSSSMTAACFNGSVSEIKLWNGVLRQDTIKAEADRCLAMVTE
jgi:hypothetical protein